MKPKGLLIAVVLLAVLGGLTWWSNTKEAAKAKTPTDASTKLLTIPDDQFQEIKIKKVSDELLGLKRENGDHFRDTLLSRGGSQDAMKLFHNFTGRDPYIEPLLERRGLAPVAEAPPPK